jgi:hypothetical protein
MFPGTPQHLHRMALDLSDTLDQGWPANDKTGSGKLKPFRLMHPADCAL